MVGSIEWTQGRKSDTSVRPWGPCCMLGMGRNGLRAAAFFSEISKSEGGYQLLMQCKVEKRMD